MMEDSSKTNDENSKNQQKANITGLYNRVATQYGQIGPDAFTIAGQGLVECLDIAVGAHVLDVGVGRGANLFPAAERVGPHGWVIGIDIAENMLQETAEDIKRRNVTQASVELMDAEHLTFEADSFDAVLCGFAIFLFPHPEQALAEFYRVLRPGGKLGITVGSNPNTLDLWYGERITAYHEQYHFPLNAGGNNVNYRTELPEYLTQAGFAQVQIFHRQADLVYSDAQQWWDAKWTHGTRYSLEHMAPDVLAQFKAEVLAKLAEMQQADGIHEEWNIQYIVGTK